MCSSLAGETTLGGTKKKQARFHSMPLAEMRSGPAWVGLEPALLVSSRFRKAHEDAENAGSCLAEFQTDSLNPNP